jgi:hyperpolarization activated cyclic nucleotide-gated potassium channel 2
MSRLGRIVRASKFSGLAKTIEESESLTKFQTFLSRHAGFARLLKSLVMILVLTHFVACIWFFLARMDEFHYDTWVVRYGLQDKPNGELYLYSYYWAITTLTTVGFGDISGGNSMERVFCMLWMMVGVGFYSFTVG